MPTRIQIPDHPDFKLIRGHAGHDVVRVQTPSGVVGYIDASISQEALSALEKKLARKLARTKRRLAASLGK